MSTFTDTIEPAFIKIEASLNNGFCNRETFVQVNGLVPNIFKSTKMKCVYR